MIARSLGTKAGFTSKRAWTNFSQLYQMDSSVGTWNGIRYQHWTFEDTAIELLDFALVHSENSEKTMR